jgi:sigma-B regulation protein RsbU (phosphoserine phosphatase)
MRLKSISLRYKLLAALTLIPMVGLMLFLLLAVNIFKKDKIAYIFDSSLSVSKTRAARVNSEINGVTSLAQAVVLSYRADTKNLAETGQYYFQREAKFEAFQIHVLNPQTGSYEKTVDLVKDSAKESLGPDQEAFRNELVTQARASGLVVRKDPVGMHVWLAARFGEASDPQHVIALTLFDATEVAQVFGERGVYTSFLLRKSTAEPIFSSSFSSVPTSGPSSGQSLKSAWGPKQIWGELSKARLPEGIGELKSPDGRAYLASYVDTGAGDLVVVSMVDREAALRAIDLLLRKSILFFIAVLSATVIIAVLASRGLTSALHALSRATGQIAEGNFTVRVSEDGGGEIETLAKGFNSMATEISRLMIETAEKARMESELATAKTVQETLFPEPNATMGNISISGHYTPASECGGDWWYYNETEERVDIWIGDATGHGAPAALLTSAARAVASVVQHDNRSVSDSLGILNRAICETSKGNMMMTFFLASIDKKSGVMTYANASHEAPLLVHESATEPSRDDFISLNAVNNPRLGEQIDRVFKETSITLEAGDRIVFYTDGVVDIKSPDAKTFGERRFLKSLSSELTAHPETQEALGSVVEKLWSFRSSTPLDDDVTLILCRFNGAA